MSSVQKKQTMQTSCGLFQVDQTSSAVGGLEDALPLFISWKGKIGKHLELYFKRHEISLVHKCHPEIIASPATVCYYFVGKLLNHLWMNVCCFFAGCDPTLLFFCCTGCLRCHTPHEWANGAFLWTLPAKQNQMAPVPKTLNPRPHQQLLKRSNKSLIGPGGWVLVWECIKLK